MKCYLPLFFYVCFKVECLMFDLIEKKKYIKIKKSNIWAYKYSLNLTCLSTEPTEFYVQELQNLSYFANLTDY